MTHLRPSQMRGVHRDVDYLDANHVCIREYRRFGKRVIAIFDASERGISAAYETLEKFNEKRNLKR